MSGTAGGEKRESHSRVKAAAATAVCVVRDEQKQQKPRAGFLVRATRGGASPSCPLPVLQLVRDGHPVPESRREGSSDELASATHGPPIIVKPPHPQARYFANNKRVAGDQPSG